MLISTDLFVLVSCIYVLVQCEIPNLNVRKLDRQLIARKRQDTLDMCRIFTEENAKIEQTKPKIVESYKNFRTSHNVRHKRDAGNPAIEAEFSEHGTIAESGGLFQKPETRIRHKRETEVHANIKKAFNEIQKDQKEGGHKYDVNPVLSKDDAKKVEKIVEQIYDEMGENGHEIKFRRNPALTTASTTNTSTPKKENSPSRRLYFGPKLLTSSNTELHSRKPNKTSMYEKARWKYGIIPYFIDSKTYDVQLQGIIMKAFDYIEKVTCIRLQKLRERPTDKRSLQEVDWVYITNPSGVRQCVHSNEKRKIDGVQMSVLGYDCMSSGDIVHEVMHILGFSHEHTRANRDQHITILWDNIKPGYKKYFEIAQAADQYTLDDLPYDYASILHYPPRAFSKNGQVTIMTEPGLKIGQREGLSEIDLEKVGTIYASECVERNKDYLLKTCPSVVKSEGNTDKASEKDIENYFKDRLWPFGLISYKVRDQMEFSIEERENIKAVISHIEQETCLQFRDISETAAAEDNPEEARVDNAVSDERPEDPSKNPPKIVSLDRDDEHHDDEHHDDEHHEDEHDEEAIPHEPAENEINNAEANNAKEDPIERIRRRSKPASLRRHANNVLILSRSAVPGCKCPKPGKPSGNAVLEINADCFNSVNDLLHLFVHVLGLDHQHNTHDRDNYLHIVWDNLTPEIREELKQKLPPAASAGFPYDYQSVMHYPWLQIKNGVTNMMYPIWNDGWAMGHWQGLSSFDVQKLNLLYFTQCSERQKQSSQK